MISHFKSLEDEKKDNLANSYSQDGFSVLKDPAATQLPFDLGGYEPDLIAVKGNSGLIIEVKSRSSRFSIDYFQSLAQEIAKHPGWRFLVVTLEDEASSQQPATEDLPTWLQLFEKLQLANALIESGALEPGILYLWSIFEAALRKQAITQNIPVERFPVKSLLNHMYSQGEISVEQIDLFKQFMHTRNRIAHGANELVDPVFVVTIFDAVKRLLMDWNRDVSD